MLKKFNVTLLTISALVLISYFVGYYHIDDIEDESHNVYFIKKIPVFKMEFTNVSKMEVWQRDAYPDGGLDKLAEYCNYRYGIQGAQTEILAQYGKLEDITLPND